jgi:hypothetical protein
MLLSIAAVLIVLWLLGLVVFPAVGGLIHLLVVVAAVLFLVRIIRGENPLK